MVLIRMKLIVVLFFFDFDEKFNTIGEDLLICLEEVLAKLKDEFR